jgi:hypothetical protein
MQAQHTKQSRYRERLRAQGLRPVQIWLPDTTRPGFAAECRRQSLLLAADPHEQEILAELATMADTEGWTE